MPLHVRPSVVPPLQSGDRLSRDEFERRFDSTPGLKNAELIEGTVYMPPPVSFDFHGLPHTDLGFLLTSYRIATPGLTGADNCSLRLDMKNMPQPDLFLMVSAACGGQARIDADGYVAGAPELIAEIAASSASIDLHAKLEIYQRAGTREYVVWRTYDREFDYFVLHNGSYRRLNGDANGVFRSEFFPGLWLASASLLASDLAAVQRVLMQGLVTEEHAAFVKQLRSRAK